MNSFQALALSLIVHILLLFWLSHIETPPQSAAFETFEVVYQDPQDKEKKRQIVEQTEVPIEKLLKVRPEEKPAQFFSQKTVRVQEQMQAKLSGAKQNRSPHSALKVPPMKSNASNEMGSPTASQMIQPHWDPGMSANDDALPADIRLGDFTVLNTDAHLFYTFFARIKDQIRYRWIHRVESAISHTRLSEIRNPTQSVWLTYIEVVLDPQGKFLKAAVMKPSGLEAFDKAAILAFRDGAPFPNPPRELVKEDGKIYLDYAFQINWDPRGMRLQQNF